MLLSKEKFVSCIEEVKQSHTYQNDLNALLKKHKIDGYLFQPDCSCSVLTLLHEIFKESDCEEIISYFVFELEFGKKWKPGITTQRLHKDVNLSNSEYLYDYLMSKIK